MIGNFFSNALTDTIHLAPEVPLWGRYSYALVDAVCVSPEPDGCERAQVVTGMQAGDPVLFPNPARDQLVVGHREGAEAQVLDAVGRLLWQGVLTSDRWVLELGAWARGTYVLRLVHRGSLETHRFVLVE